MPLACVAGSTLYGLTSTSAGVQIVSSVIGSLKSTLIGPVYPNRGAGLGLTVDGSRAFFVDNLGTVVEYSVTSGAFTQLLDSGVTGVTAGAVDPVNGSYYFATAFALYEFDATADTVQQVGTFGFQPTGLAFDRTGHAYVVAGGVLSTFSAPTAAGSTGLALAPLTSGLPASHGLSFGVDGNLYLATSDGVRGFNPTTGAATGPAIGAALTDLTGCGNPYLLAATTSQPDGTVAPSDRFTVALSSVSPALSSTGPLLAQPGSSYAVTESMTSGDPANYSTTWTCVDAVTGATIAAGCRPRWRGDDWPIRRRCDRHLHLRQRRPQTSTAYDDQPGECQRWCDPGDRRGRRGRARLPDQR